MRPSKSCPLSTLEFETLDSLQRTIYDGATLKDAIHEDGVMKAVVREDDNKNPIFISKSLLALLELTEQESHMCNFDTFALRFRPATTDCRFFSDMITDARSNISTSSKFTVIQRNGFDRTVLAAVVPVASEWQIITHILLVLVDPPPRTPAPVRPRPASNWEIAATSATAVRYLAHFSNPRSLSSPTRHDVEISTTAAADFQTAADVGCETESSALIGANFEPWRRKASSPTNAPVHIRSPFATVERATTPSPARRFSGQPAPALRVHRVLKELAAIPAVGQSRHHSLSPTTLPLPNRAGKSGHAWALYRPHLIIPTLTPVEPSLALPDGGASAERSLSDQTSPAAEDDRPWPRAIPRAASAMVGDGRDGWRREPAEMGGDVSQLPGGGRFPGSIPRRILWRSPVRSHAASAPAPVQAAVATAAAFERAAGTGTFAARAAGGRRGGEFGGHIPVQRCWAQ
jgi:hypothetical protein